MEDLIRVIARAGNLDLITVSFVAHPGKGENQWRVVAMKQTGEDPVTFDKLGYTNDDLRNALIGLATAVGNSQ